MNEKKILAMCDHPFLLTLAASYQDEDELYMLLQLAPAGWQNLPGPFTDTAGLPHCGVQGPTSAGAFRAQLLRWRRPRSGATFADQALGGELFSILRERNKFDEPTSRFYASNVCAAFEYLHDLKIVYRDLKPARTHSRRSSNP